MNRLVVVLAALAAGVVVLAAGLRPDAFYAGDPGVKLIATRNVLDHPSRPFDITLPSVGSEHFPFVEPFFAVHADHAHAITSSLFPVLTAPFLETCGLRGLYVLPALGFLLFVAGCGWIATGLDTRRSAASTAAAAALTTPLLFYGLEFWEHAPAVAVAALALALLVRGRALASGLLLAVAVLLRPEAAWFALAVAIGSPLLPRRPNAATWMLTLGGFMLALAPLELYWLWHFGTLIPPHVGTNAAELGQDWLASRSMLFSSWFAGRWDMTFWGVAPAVACAAATVGLRSERDGRGFLWSVAVADIALVLLTAPNDGGGQWGSRYLLFAYIPLAVLATDALEAASRRRVAGVIVLAVVLAASVWIQRSAYRQLRGTKITFGRLVDFVETQVPRDGYAVTDVWWLDQIAAASTAGRQVFYVPTASDGRGIVRRLSDATVPAVTVFRSSSESPDLGAWIDGTCYFEERRDSISTRNIVAVHLRHRCS